MSTKKRFVSWELTGKGKITGVLPLPDGQEPDDYTELETDKDLVIGIKEYFEGYAEPLIRKPAYDAKKRLQHSDYTDPTSGLSGRNQYEYDDRGCLRARQELDPQGKVRFRIEVQCDEQGRILEEKIFNQKGQLEKRHTYEHDAAGRVTKDTKYGSDGKTVEGVYQLTYDAQGRVLSNGYYPADGTPPNLYHYKWDAQNRRTEIALSHGEAPTFVSRFTFDEKGKRVGVEHLDGAGSAFARNTRGPDGKRELWVAPARSLGPRTTALLEGKSIKELANMTPEQVNALAILAYSHFEHGRFEQARAMYETLTTLDSKEPAFPAGAAVACLAQEEPEKALRWYERALARSPTHVPSLVGMAEVLLQQGEIEKALQRFKEAFANAPSKDDPAIRRAQLIVTAISQAAGGAK